MEIVRDFAQVMRQRAAHFPRRGVPKGYCRFTGSGHRQRRAIAGKRNAPDRAGFSLQSRNSLGVQLAMEEVPLKAAQVIVAGEGLMVIEQLADSVQVADLPCLKRTTNIGGVNELFGEALAFANGVLAGLGLP